jgi:hypothetical protein
VRQIQDRRLLAAVIGAVVEVGRVLIVGHQEVGQVSDLTSLEE